MFEKSIIGSSIKEEFIINQLLIKKWSQKQQEHNQQRRLLHKITASCGGLLWKHIQMKIFINTFHPIIQFITIQFYSRQLNCLTPNSRNCSKLIIIVPLLQFLLQQSNPLNQPMKNKRVQAQKWAYKFTKPTIMKFQPIQDYQQPSTEQQNTFVTRIKQFFSPPKVKPKGHIKRMNSLVSTDVRQQLLKKHIAKKPLLKYVKRLTNEHVLIGNQDQIDAMSIGGIINEFVDTQFMWSINIKRAILHMAIDYKKNYIILLPDKEVIVYKYDAKLIRQKPVVLTTFKLPHQVRFVQVIKDSVFVLCYETGIQVLYIDQSKGIRVTAQKKYDIPAENHLALLQIPPPYENILNVFFEETLETSTSLPLWNIQIQFSDKDVKMSKAHKVYDIPKFLKKFIRLENYSKDIYLINLGRLIYAVRKGYIIDFANVNISSQDNYLKYISYQKLMHISSSKVEIYQFKVDLTVNPPRLSLESTDSIQLPPFPNGYEYVDAVEILTDNFAIFYQTKQEYNKMMHGQLKYGFVLSHSVKLQDKINQLLPHQIKNVNIETINEKADMVNKMGLQRKDIYLRLWNNSQKTSIEDYKILLDTLDYDTIKLQIQKKLKKASMNLRQMILLQQGCLAMLNKSVYGPNATKDDIKNYFISHLLIRKFELYRLFSNVDKKEGRPVIEDEEGKLLINIQNYNYYKTVDIKFLLYELINIYCNQEKNVIIKIRILLKHFKFSLRTQYQEILQNIIAKTKKKFLKILEAMPELLPYDHPPNASKDEEESYNEGIWQDISSEQWQKHLFLDNLLTIDNKQALEQTCSNVWFKRYWLTHHEFINKTKKQISEIHKLNCSDATFYNVIQKIFDNLKDYSSIKSILDHIQDHYQRLPTHLFGKIFLYRKLYQQFKENKRINKVEETIDNFKDFLKLKDQDIFKVMFNFQKAKKNFILKEMKPLYVKLAGSQIFNEGLLNYFASDLSEISDIKYLLNRMNNQKIEFHEQNEGIYEVLVRGMQLKLKLGSPLDIPIDEVLIYIENIPLSANNPIMKDLETMRLINQQSKRFKKIQLNMSIFQMMKNVDDVVASLVAYGIKEANVLNMRQYAQIKDITHRIIDDVQQLKKKIFSQTEYPQLTLFAYLTKLLEQQQLVGIVEILLQDEWINQNFNLNQTMIENMVLYMYKWRMNNKPSYAQSGPYLKELVNLLPAGNKCREYIEAQIQFSQILSTPEENIYYPLSNGKEYFTIIQLQNIINNTPATHLLTVNIEHLHSCALKIQQISTDNRCSQIKLHDLYQMIIFRLIECGLLREVISKIKTLIEIQSESSFNFIYPALVVAKIAPQLIDENRNLLLKCAGYLFNKPKQLTEILDTLMSIKATNNVYKTLLKKYHDKYRINSIYSQNSPVLQDLYLKLLQTDEQKQNFNTILRHSLEDVLSYKQQFYRKPEFYISFIILCNDPYVLIKYFYCNKYTINMKDFRCFLSLITKQEAFSSYQLLQFSKRMFSILFQSIAQNKNLQSNIQQMRSLPLSICKEIHRIKETKSLLQKMLSKSLDKFKHKIKAVNAKIERKKARGKIEPEEKKIERFRQRLANPDEKNKALVYPFLDSDDTPKSNSQILKKQQRKQINIMEGFDAKFERETLMKRSVKEIGLFISIEKQKQQRSRYYTEKYTHDGIFGSLQNDKRIGYVLQTAMNKAFRQSVKRSPRKLRIGKVTNQFLEPDSLDLIEVLSSRRSRSPTIISQQQLQQIHKIQEKIVLEEVTPDIGNILVQAFIIDDIIKGNQQITENTEFNFQPLQKYKKHASFPDFLKEIIQLAYGKQIPFIGVLWFIKKLNEKYSQCRVNNLWLDIYMKAQSLQNKFSLDLPLRSIFAAEGLFIDSLIPQRLFNYLLPFIVLHSDDQNILKICKVVTLAFKKSQLEQEILFSYLIKLFLKFESSLYFSSIKQNDLRMQKQKIFLILNKIPIKLLLSREEQLVKDLLEQHTRKEIIGLVITSFRRRYDMKAAEYMEQKWIRKHKELSWTNLQSSK